jgi:hypothetical protein
MAKKKEAPREHIHVETFSRQLKVELTEKEVAERADRAAHVLRLRDSKEDDRKAANTAAKSQIEELEAELRNLSSEVRDRATYRQVECERRYDYRLRQVVEKRLDTSIILHEHAMTEAEAQLPLGLEDTRTEADKLGKAVVSSEEPLPTQKRGKPKQGKGRRAPRAEARP